MAEASEIVIESEALGPAELKNALRQVLAAGGSIELELRKRESSFRLDPALLVAVITGGFKVLPVLVTALLGLARREQPPRQTIVLMDGSGVIVEIPADLPAERVAQLLEAARGRDVKRIDLVSPPEAAGPK